MVVVVVPCLQVSNFSVACIGIFFPTWLGFGIGKGSWSSPSVNVPLRSCPSSSPCNSENLFDVFTATEQKTTISPFVPRIAQKCFTRKKIWFQNFSQNN